MKAKSKINIEAVFSIPGFNLASALKWVWILFCRIFAVKSWRFGWKSIFSNFFLNFLFFTERDPLKVSPPLKVSYRGRRRQIQDESDYHFPCPNNCGRKYKHKFNLYNHMKYECGVPKKFKCQICEREFALKGNFKTHMASIHQVLIN